MKKILSIILALGLVVSMSLAAMPALAQTCTAVVTLDPATACEGATTEYCVSFESKYHMDWGDDKFGIEFPAEVGFAATVTATVEGETATAVRDGQVVWVTIPEAAGNFAPGDAVIVCIKGVINPAAAGEYTLNVWVDKLCCPAEQINCGKFKIFPAQSTYKFVMDFAFGDCLEDMAVDYVPPFEVGNNYTFEYTLKVDEEGCKGYDRAIIKVILCDAPEGAEVDLTLYGIHLGVEGWHDFTLDEEDDFFYWGFWDGDITTSGFELAPDHDETLPGFVVVDTKSEDCTDWYEICFELWALGEEGTCEDPGVEDKLVYEQSYKTKAHQWVYCDQIDLQEKWNLISLPKVPFCCTTSPEAFFASFVGIEDLISVWHYDGCTGEWLWWAPGNEASTLTEIVDGKSYWVRMDYTLGVSESHTLVIFGTPTPGPTELPSAYPVCEGWNMVGFRSQEIDIEADDYLAGTSWNRILGYTGGQNGTFTWLLGDDELVPGDGYWIAFAADGTIYP